MSARLVPASILGCFLAGTLAAQGWVDRTPANPLAGPPSRVDGSLCWDEAHGYMLLYGGVNFSQLINDTWTWNGVTWTRRSTSSFPQQNGTGQRRQTAMVYHTPTSEVLLVCQGGTWTWTGSDWQSRGYVPFGPGPNGNGTPCDLGLGRDQGRNQTVLFVGSRYANGTLAYQGETWLWDGFAWSQRPTATTPYPAKAPSMAFDPASGKLLLATTDNANTQTWFWEWNGSNWTQRGYAPAPAGQGVLAADTAHNKVIAFDGSLSPTPNHTWTLANGTSAQLGTAIEPAHRIGAAMAFDPVRNRTVLFGGSLLNDPNNYPQYIFLGDTWEFDPGASAAYVAYGTGCAGSRGVPAIAAQNGSAPRAGTTFTLQVNNLPFAGPVFLFFGVSSTTYGPTPLPFPLAGLGAPGCSILASGEDLRILNNVLGSAIWQFPMPNLPGTSFYNQVFAIDPAANQLGLTASNGGHGTIGF